jgi:hypothetical protein
VIASHYAEPVERRLCAAATLRSAPADEAQAVKELPAGDRFLMLDEALGWAWGYAGEDRRVGYVTGRALAQD